MEWLTRPFVTTTDKIKSLAVRRWRPLLIVIFALLGIHGVSMLIVSHLPVPPAVTIPAPAPTPKPTAVVPVVVNAATDNNDQDDSTTANDTSSSTTTTTQSGKSSEPTSKQTVIATPVVATASPANASNPLGYVVVQHEGGLKYGMVKCQHEGTWNTCLGLAENTGDKAETLTLEDCGNVTDNEGNYQLIRLMGGIKFGSGNTVKLIPHTQTRFFLRFLDKSQGTSTSAVITLHAMWGGGDEMLNPLADVPIS